MMSVRWFYKEKEEPQNPKLLRWEKMLESGEYKVQESESLYGPWRDVDMRDDGSIHQLQPYMRMELKNGVMRIRERRKEKR